MRTKAMLIGALCLLLVGGLILGGAGAAAQGSDPTPLLIQVEGSLTGVSAEDGEILWFFTGDGYISTYDIHEIVVSADRVSLLLDARTAFDDMGLFRIELPLRLISDLHYVATLYTDMYRPGPIAYALTPERDVLVGVALRCLVITGIEDDLGPDDGMPCMSLEPWILPDQEISGAEVVIDPLARHAYARVSLISEAYGYDDYVAFWVNLADLAARPVATDIAWASWSEDGAYLATFSPNEGLVIRGGGTLEALPWSADLPAPLEAHGFVWGTDGQTAYYRTGEISGSALHRIELATGESLLLVDELRSHDRPAMQLGGGGGVAVLKFTDPAGMFLDYYRMLDLTSGEWVTEHPLEGRIITATSPTRDFILMLNGANYYFRAMFYAWREGIELAGWWEGPAVLYGWTTEGLPILQTLSFEDIPERYTPDPFDRAALLPDPGWYVFDIAEDGAAIWTPLPCPDCRVIPAGFPEVQLSVQRPDGAPVFAVVGTGDAGAGVYVVDLVAGTTKLVFAQEPERVTQIDWLAPGSLPLESAPRPTHDPAEGLG